jgi:hypothetical protein
MLLSASPDENLRAARANLTRTNGWHIALIALIAAYFLIFPIYRGFFPLEIAPNEGWNAYHQDAAFGSRPLYPAVGELIVNNYPPLSFYVIGWIASWAGNALFVGRALSVAAIFGLGFVIAIIIRQFRGGAAAAAVGGLWFVATMAGPFDQFVGMDDPQLPGQLLMACALAWFLARDSRGLSAEPPIILMVVAGFWKHNIVAIPVTVLVWLILRDGRRAIRPCLVGLGGVLFGLVLCWAIYGDVFIANLFAPRKFAAWRMLLSLGRLQFVLPALVLWAVWAWRERSTRAAQFTALFIGIALVVHIVQWSGFSVVNNSQFDLVIATAIGLGLVYEYAKTITAALDWSTARSRTLVVAVIVIRLMANGHVEPALILFDPNYRRTVSEHTAIAYAQADQVASVPGLVACSIKLVCRMAGKPFVYDDFKVGQLLESGAMSADQLAEILNERRITYVDIDPRAGGDSIRRDIFQKLRGAELWN